MAINMENKKVTIAEIADELGLSTATVSNVIHGKTKKISDETVKRVQQKIEEKNYIPNMAAILLAQNNSRIIGIIINDHEKYEGRVLEDGYVAAALNALSKVVNEAGYFLMVKTTDNWMEIPKIGSMWNMDGIIVAGFCMADYQKLRQNMHIPFVVYDGFFQETDRIVNIAVNHYDGGYQAGKYLKEMGHRSALCLADNNVCMDAERMQGFRDAFAPGDVDFWQIPILKEERYEYYDNQLKILSQYTAVFAASDYYALDFIHFVQSKGMNVPSDISVVGFDDIISGLNNMPPLTTIRQNPLERARKAITCLQAMNEGKEIPYKVVLPVELVERQSVKRI